jgi:hypothetical protein
MIKGLIPLARIMTLFAHIATDLESQYVHI